MLVLMVISITLALLVVLPKTLYVTGHRSICPNCRYDLVGFEVTGTCPECGQAYDKNTLMRVGREMRWRVLPKVLLLMILPAGGPTLFLLVYTSLLQHGYRWGWENCWHQATQRDISYAGYMSVPLLLSSWLTMMHPNLSAKGNVPWEDRLERPDFWRRFAVLIPLGIVAVGSLGLVVWLYRRYAFSRELMAPAFVLVLGLLGLAHALLENAYARRHPKAA